MGFGTLLIELNGDDLRLRRADPLGEWSEDDYDALSDGVIVGRIMKAAHTDTRLCGDARGRHGRVR
jgi:hypothetical protein